VGTALFQGGPVNIVWGLFSFGVMTGVVAGLSVTAGAATGLMTGLFSFVGGAVLTYAGFRKTPLGTKAEAVVAAIQGALPTPSSEEPAKPGAKKAGDVAGSKQLVAPPSGKAEPEPQPLVDLRQVGSALFGVSGGVIVGLFIGMWFRFSDPLGLRSDVVAKQPHQAFGLNSAITKDPTFVRVTSRLHDKWYGTADCTFAVTDLSELSNACVTKCSAAPPQ